MKRLRRFLATPTAKDCYYKILGVERSAPFDEIRRTFLTLAKTLHPDVAPDEQSSERFRLISEAYTILSNPSLRAQYNRSMNYSETHVKEDRGLQFENEAEYQRQERKLEEQKSFHVDLEEYLRLKYSGQRINDPLSPLNFEMGMFEKKIADEKEAEEKYQRVETPQGVLYYDKVEPKWWEKIPYSLRVSFLFFPLLVVFTFARKALQIDKEKQRVEDPLEVLAQNYRGYIGKIVPGSSL